MKIFLITIFLVASLPVAAVPNCESEDASNCYWNAAVSGNGTGQSFIDVNGTAIYLPK
jgi:hypothetical protein